MWDDEEKSCQVDWSPGEVSVVARGGRLVKGGLMFVEQQKRDVVRKPFDVDILAEVVCRALDTGGKESKVGARTWTPDEILLDKPNAARIYDYLLDGYHNFEADRIVAGRMIEIYPDMRLAAQAGRAFLRRVVNFRRTGH